MPKKRVKKEVKNTPKSRFLQKGQKGSKRSKKRSKKLQNGQKGSKSAVYIRRRG